MHDAVVDRLDAHDLAGVINTVTGVDQTVVFVVNGDAQAALVDEHAQPGRWSTTTMREPLDLSGFDVAVVLSSDGVPAAITEQSAETGTEILDLSRFG